MKILVTGYEGLIGHEVVRLLQKEHEVITPSRETFDLAKPINQASLPEHIDAIIHLAQSNQYRDFPNSVNNVFAVNTHTTLQLLDYAKRAKAKIFIYGSSGSVYKENSEPLVERTSLLLDMHSASTNFYALSKLMGEALTQQFSTFLTVINLRYFTVYGPRQKNSMFIPRLINSISSGKNVSLTGEDGMRFSLTSYKDAARATVAALHLTESLNFNIAGDCTFSLRNISEVIGKALGKMPQYELITNRPSINVLADNTLMKEKLVTPKHSFTSELPDVLSIFSHHSE
jgi:UDP-glucose 4-epimerase